MNDRQIDLVEEGFDLAIRVGQLQDSNLIARKLAEVNFAVCASPDYLRKNGEPVHPSELSNREVLVYSNIPVSQQWSFELGSDRFSPRVKHRISANNGELLAKMASYGLGLTAGPLFYFQNYIERGELKPLLCDYRLNKAGMYAVYPPGRLVSRRVKMLSDFLFEYFRDKTI